MSMLTFMRPVAGIVLVAGAVLSLTACETLGMKSSKGKAPDLACPRVETPAQIANMSQGGANPLDLSVTANLRVTSTECDVEKDGDKVKLTAEVTLTATKGPSLKKEEAKVPFFAAVMDNNGQLSNKKLYETTFDFSDGITDREEVTITFELSRAQAAVSRVYIGYQLTKDAWQAATADAR